MNISTLINARPLPLVEDAPSTNGAASTPEKLVPVKDAAEALGLPTWKLRRAAKQGAFPTYTLLNSRRLVRLSEVIAAIEASRQGGGA
jgi:hypothetical protein